MDLCKPHLVSLGDPEGLLLFMRLQLKFCLIKIESLEVLLTQEVGDTDLRNHSGSCLRHLCSMSLCSFIYTREDWGKLALQVSRLF